MRDVNRYLAEDLPALLRLLEGTDVRELELAHDGVRVRLRRAEPGEDATIQPDIAPIEEELLGPQRTEIVAPLVGTFYRASKPGMPPLVDVGVRVEDDTVVGIVEALHVLTEVEAGCTGTVTQVFATDGQPVEYGRVLFEVELGG